MKNQRTVQPGDIKKWSDPNKGHKTPKFETKSFDVGGRPGGLMSVMLRLAETERLEKPFAQSGIVYSCVQIRAKLLAQAVPCIWESDDDEAEQVDRNDPLRKLLRRPNGLGGGLKFWRMISQHFDLAGGTFLFMTKGKTSDPISPGEIPGAIWPVREDHVEIVLGKNKAPEFYRFESGNEQVTFPAHAVAHLFDPDPDNPTRGIGPMQAAFRTANNLFKSEAFDDALVENGGQIGGFITPEEGELTEEQAQDLQTSLKQEHTSPKNSGKYAVIPKGIKVEQTAFSPRDMQAKDLRVQGRNSTMMIFGVTPPLLGIVEDVNRANGATARRVFYESHGIPQLEFLADEFEAHVFPKIGYEGKTFSFNVSGIPGMREDAKAVQDRVRGWMEMGRSFKEAIAIEQVEIDGIDDMEGADERFRANGLVPMDEVDPEGDVDEEDEDDVPSEGDDEAPPESDTVETSIRSLKADADRQRRIGVIAEIEKKLAKHDRAITRAIARVFKSFIRAQVEKINEVIQQEDHGEASVVLPWNDFPAISASTRSWCNALGMEIPRRWKEVRGISENELESLLVKADARWRNSLWGAAEKQLKATVEEAASALAAELGSMVQVDATHPAIIRFLSSKEILLKEGPMSVVAEQVRHTMIDVLAHADNAGTLADRILSVLNELQEELDELSDRLGTRAAMIARTETASASNAARDLQMKESGVTQKEWASAGDEVVRESHQIDGEIATIGEPFSNGLRHPGEVGAPAELIINCRCTTIPVVPDPE